jgi:hypothetical protein
MGERRDERGLVDHAFALQCLSFRKHRSKERYPHVRYEMQFMFKVYLWMSEKSFTSSYWKVHRT